MNNLLRHNKTYIELNQLEELLNINDYKELHATITDLVDQGKLKPVNASGKNGKNPPLYTKYRIAREKKDTEDIRKEIISEFPPLFSIDYYLNSPEKYLKHRDHLLKLCHYFKHKKKSLNLRMSINERSFDIFGDEKLLRNDSDISSILSNIKVPMSILNIYNTPEPFFYYSKTRKSPQSILIIENKDTWYTFRQLMREGQQKFLGKEFHTVIYGEGKKVISSLFDIDEGEDEHLKGAGNRFYYFGDLDYEGILIYEELSKRNTEYRNIKVFEEAYIKMIQLSHERDLQKMKKGQNGKYVQEFLNRFDRETSREIKEILDKGLYIPQEILSYAVLRED